MKGRGQMFDFSTDLYTINDTTIILRLVFSVIFGGIIGLERGRVGRPAGLRTHILVCLGSALAMMTGEYIFGRYSSGDPTRMAAQVISGIGFLGAGTILVTGRNQVKGLTTAAGLWATACMGIAIGSGFYKAATLATLLIVFVTVVLHKFEDYLLAKSRLFDVYIEFNSAEKIASSIENIKAAVAEIEGTELVKSAYNNNSSVAAIMTIKLKKDDAIFDTIAVISKIDGIDFVEEI